MNKMDEESDSEENINNVESYYNMGLRGRMSPTKRFFNDTEIERN